MIKTQNMFEDVKDRFSYFKFALAFVAMIGAIALFAIYGGEYVRQYERQQEGRLRLATIDKKLQEVREKRLREEQDTTGGATPQETLRLFLGAAEKKDFALAARYFVLDGQERWEQELTALDSAGKLPFLIAAVRMASEQRGSYSANRTRFTFPKPASLHLTLSRAGVWKIETL